MNRPARAAQATSVSVALAEPYLTARDRQIRHWVMIHTTTTAMISVAITQFMTIVAHIVAIPGVRTHSGGGCGAPSTRAHPRARPRNRFFWRHFGRAPEPRRRLGDFVDFAGVRISDQAGGKRIPCRPAVLCDRTPTDLRVPGRSPRP